MAITSRIDKETKTVYVTADGNIEIEELIDNERKIIKDLEFEKGYDKYIDFSGAKPAPNADFDKIKMIAEFIESTQYARGKCKWSIYAPGKDAYIYSDLFAELTDHLELETKVFRDEKEAKNWLGIESHFET